MLKGGDSGPAVVPGEPDKSLLIEAVRYQNADLQMPPKGKLPDAADRRPDGVGEDGRALAGRTAPAAAGAPKRRSTSPSARRRTGRASRSRPRRRRR